MKKRNIFIKSVLFLSIALIGIGNANAQIYLTPEDNDYDRLNGSEFSLPDFPGQDSDLDWTPIGDGLWLLGGLAGAYLLNKRRRKDDE